MQGELKNECDERTGAEVWHPCQVIRFLGHNRCVIRLIETGAVIPISLSTQLDSNKAAMATPFRAMAARVILRDFEGEGFGECELEVEWNSVCFPPPQRYKRRKTQP